MRIACILPAAGSGTRMGSAIPKPFLPLAGKPVIFRTLERLKEAVAPAETVLVLPPSHDDAIRRDFGRELERRGVTAFIRGGVSRQESVALGLTAVGTDCGIIMVHDAVRPFAPAGLIRDLCAKAEACGAALPVLPVTDTIKRVDGDRIGETVPREGLFAVQTPQVFRSELLRAAYRNIGNIDASLTDDAMLVEAIGGRVHAVPGSRYNLKLTTPEDMAMAEAFLAAGLI